MSILEPPAGPPVQSPTSIDHLLEVITQLTELIKDQAADLRASKRLTRLLRVQQLPADRRQDHELPLHRDLDRVPGIIDDLGRRFVDALRVAARAPGPSAQHEGGQEDSGQPISNAFVTLGLADDSEAWSLKYHAFQAARAFAESPPIRTRGRRFGRDRGKVMAAPYDEGPPQDLADVEERSVQPGSERARLGRMKKRVPALKLGNSIVGSGIAAIPVVGGLVGEGYAEVKDNLEELGNLARATGRGLLRPVRWVARKIRRRDPGPEPVHSVGATA